LGAEALREGGWPAFYSREIKQGIARWDAYLEVPAPDALAAEFTSRNVEFFRELSDDGDGLRGCELKGS
jgi:hypothetical protein